MTSFSIPDYHVKLKTEEKHKLNQFAGNTFTVSLLRQNRANLICGMITIPATHQNNNAKQAWACLWIDSKKAIIPLNEPVLVTLLEECDPMYRFSDEKAVLRQYLPVTFKAEITKL